METWEVLFLTGVCVSFVGFMGVLGWLSAGR